MLFLADEDFPGIAVRWLREVGHDVVWARTHMPGDADSVLLATAQKQFRVILTCDKDFGELAFHWGLPASCGVVFFRLTTSSPELFLRRLKALMENEEVIGFADKFSVVEADRVRSRPLIRIS